MFSLRFYLGMACCCLFSAQAAPVASGKITIGLAAEPKTLNPVVAADDASREVIGRMSAGLITLDRQTQRPKAVLAEGWQVSPNGLHYTVRLRSGLRFSDGVPFGVDDVLFSFRVCMNSKVRPALVTKIDVHTVRFDLAAPTAAWAQMFDEVPMLSHQTLERAYLDGTLNQIWAVAGMGPFRLKEYHAGRGLVLERNPYYWKALQPYLGELDFVFTHDDKADVLTQVSARDVALLRSRHYEVRDLGRGTVAECLVFGSGERQAPAAAIDRERIVKLVYGGFADPVWDKPSEAGVSEAFTISISDGNAEEETLAKLIQEDLARIGTKVEIVTGKSDARLMRCGMDETAAAIRLVIPHVLVAARERVKQLWF